MEPTTATAPKKAKVSRPTLDDMALTLGKRVRLHRLFYGSGLRNGTLMILPIDQGIEHGPVDFFENPDSADPDFQWRLAAEGRYNGVACHYGLARKYMERYAGRVPLILKLNGKTAVPSDDEPLSTLTGTVEDAVALGADAVGYTLYVGSPRQDDDIAQMAMVREDCDKYNMPLIVWGYPRGASMEEKGGRDSLYAIDYAARMALELGADIVKLNLPKRGSKDPKQPKEYSGLEWTLAEGAERIVKSAGRVPVLVSGGSKVGDDDLIDKVRISMEAGAIGLIFGRNFWQRPLDQALAISERVQKEVLAHYPT